MSCPIKVNSTTIEPTVHTSCYCVLDLLCVTTRDGGKTARSFVQFLRQITTATCWVAIPCRPLLVISIQLQSEDKPINV